MLDMSGETLRLLISKSSQASSRNGSFTVVKVINGSVNPFVPL